MTPIFTIKVADKDYTDQIHRRLLEFRLVDQPGVSSDYIQLVLDDREQMRVPKHGELIKVHLGYEETELVVRGSYVHDSTSFDVNPNILTIRAAAINFRQALGSQKNKVHQNISLAGLVRNIASEHGYSSAVDSKYETIIFKNIIQQKESDLRLLTRYAETYGALFKAMGQNLVFVPKGTSKDARMKQVFGKVTLTPSQVSRCSVTRQDKTRYSGVIAKWKDPMEPLAHEILIGEDTKVFIVTEVFSSAEAAQLAASAKFDRLVRSSSTAKISCEGNPYFTAESELELKGFRQGIDDHYIIVEVEHIITKKSGYRCEIVAELAYT
ncbi:phage late control D family protein [Pseudomonas sp. HK3]